MREDYDLVNEGVVKYVDEEIMPRYKGMAGHRDGHIRQVIARSLDFAKRINSGEIKTGAEDFAGLPKELRAGKVDYDMCFVIAAYHDLGRMVDDERHHLISAGVLLTDERLPEWFDREQLRVMADAVMDHRASAKQDPLTIYGRIVSSADRNTKPEVMLERCYEKLRADYPDESIDAVIERTRKTLREKYGGKSGYAAKRMYFPDPAFEECLAEIERITREPGEFRKLYDFGEGGGGWY